MKTQLSEKQLAANRANAAKSTGPRTAGGKARSARNSYKHGLCAETVTAVGFDDPDALARLREDAIREYQPITSQELQAVDRIAIGQLQMLRAARLEAGMIQHAVGFAHSNRYVTAPTGDSNQDFAFGL